MLYVIARLVIEPGSLGDVIKAASPCLKATREEVGCISYDLYVDATDETRLAFVERWESRAALEGHFRAPHLKAWREAGFPIASD